MSQRLFILFTMVVASACYFAPAAQAGIDGFGQVLQINTRFQSFLGRPEWTIEIRDVDHGQTMPYIFDITRGQNYWLLFTYSKHYLITASTMQFSSYRSRYNVYNTHQIKDFCGLESKGRISRGESMYIWIEGDLSPYSNNYRCHITRFKDDYFTIAPTAS